MWGQPAQGGSLDWSWVDDQLTGADVYWIVVGAVDRPQPRPVWGIWRGERLLLSIGSPRVNAAIGDGSPVTVHLGGAVDIVIVEGTVTGKSDDHDAVAAYNSKYDWDYRIDVYGSFTVIEPDKVMAWQAMGAAGRDGSRAAGRWRFGS